MMNTMELSLKNKGLSNSDLRQILNSLPSGASYRRLNLGNNKLTKFPNLTKYPQFSNLEYLYIGENKITNVEINYIPSSIKVFTASKNRITELPDLSSFKQLENLKLSDNRIQIIPNHHLPSGLKLIDFKWNSITEVQGLPLSMRLICLKQNPIETLGSNCFLQKSMYDALRLEVDANLKEPPRNVIASGYEKVKEYYNQSGESTKDQNTMEICDDINEKLTINEKINHVSNITDDTKNALRTYGNIKESTQEKNTKDSCCDNPLEYFPNDHEDSLKYETEKKYKKEQDSSHQSNSTEIKLELTNCRENHTRKVNSQKSEPKVEVLYNDLPITSITKVKSVTSPINKNKIKRKDDISVESSPVPIKRVYVQQKSCPNRQQNVLPLNLSRQRNLRNTFPKSGASQNSTLTSSTEPWMEETRPVKTLQMPDLVLDTCTKTDADSATNTDLNEQQTSTGRLAMKIKIDRKHGGMYTFKEANMLVTIPNKLKTFASTIAIMSEEKSHFQNLPVKEDDILSNVITFLPHGAFFDQHIMVRFPYENNQKEIALMYTNSDIMDEKEDVKENTLKWINLQANTPSGHKSDMFWYLSNGYCYFYTTHFCCLFLIKKSGTEIPSEPALFLCSSVHGMYAREEKYLKISVLFHCTKCHSRLMSSKHGYGKLLGQQLSLIHGHNDKKVKIEVQLTPKEIVSNGYEKEEFGADQFIHLCKSSNIKVTTFFFRIKTKDEELNKNIYIKATTSQDDINSSAIRACATLKDFINNNMPSRPTSDANSATTSQVAVGKKQDTLKATEPKQNNHISPKVQEQSSRNIDSDSSELSLESVDPVSNTKTTKAACKKGENTKNKPKTFVKDKASDTVTNIKNVSATSSEANTMDKMQTGESHGKDHINLQQTLTFKENTESGCEILTTISESSGTKSIKNTLVGCPTNMSFHTKLISKQNATSIMESNQVQKTQECVTVDGENSASHAHTSSSTSETQVVIPGSPASLESTSVSADESQLQTSSLLNKSQTGDGNSSSNIANMHLVNQATYQQSTEDNRSLGKLQNTSCDSTKTDVANDKSSESIDIEQVNVQQTIENYTTPNRNERDTCVNNSNGNQTNDVGKTERSPSVDNVMLDLQLQGDNEKTSKHNSPQYAISDENYTTRTNTETEDSTGNRLTTAAVNQNRNNIDLNLPSTSSNVINNQLDKNQNSTLNAALVPAQVINNNFIFNNIMISNAQQHLNIMERNGAGIMIPDSNINFTFSHQLLAEENNFQDLISPDEIGPDKFKKLANEVGITGGEEIIGNFDGKMLLDAWKVKILDNENEEGVKSSWKTLYDILVSLGCTQAAHRLNVLFEKYQLILNLDILVGNIKIKTFKEITEKMYSKNINFGDNRARNEQVEVEDRFRNLVKEDLVERFYLGKNDSQKDTVHQFLKILCVVLRLSEAIKTMSLKPEDLNEED